MNTNTLTPVKTLNKTTGKLATPKQVETLVKFGVSRDDAQMMTISAASKELDRLMKDDKALLEAATEQAKAIDLREYAATFTALRGHGKELEGPCPKCGGTKRFHVQATQFFCRDCYPFDNGRPHDAIGFVMWVMGCDFRSAVQTLTGGQSAVTGVTKRLPEQKRSEEQTEAWRNKAAVIVEEAHKRLFDDSDQEAQAGRDYLENVRKLEPETWMAYKLGFISDAPLPGTWDDEKKTRTMPGQPAIVVPWFKGDKVVAVRYRFLQAHTYVGVDGEERTESKSSLYGSDFKSTMFGGQALEGNEPEHSTVLRAEGEFNAMAARQVTKDTNFDVFSIGSQDAKPTEAALKYLKRYRTEMCWLDEADKAGKAECGSDDAYRIKSKIDGEKQDANDLLIAGKLAGIIALHRLEATRGDKLAQEALLFDLMSGASGWYGCDKLVAQVIVHLSKQLSIKVEIGEVRPGVWRVESFALTV